MVSAVTGDDGQAIIRNLKPGEYSLAATYLGIGAAWDCFHVEEASEPETLLAYEWGKDATPVREAAGVVRFKVLGDGDNPIERVLHSKKTGAASMPLRLTDVESKETYRGRHRFGW